MRVELVLIGILTVGCGARTNIGTHGLASIVDAATDAGSMTDAATDVVATNDAGCTSDAQCECTHTPGCEVHAFANDATTLYDVSLPSGQVKAIGPTGAELTDLALSPTGDLFGVGPRGIYKVSQNTGAATLLPDSLAWYTGADFSRAGNARAPAGTLWISNVNVGFPGPTYTSGLSVDWFPPNITSSGDIAWMGSRLFGTGAGGGGDELVEFDVEKGTANVLGPCGYACIDGLVAAGSTLYGLTCEGRIVSIDTQTGAATELTEVPIAFAGASPR